MKKDMQDALTPLGWQFRRPASEHHNVSFTHKGRVGDGVSIANAATLELCRHISASRAQPPWPVLRLEVGFVHDQEAVRDELATRLAQTVSAFFEERGLEGAKEPTYTPIQVMRTTGGEQIEVEYVPYDSRGGVFYWIKGLPDTWRAPNTSFFTEQGDRGTTFTVSEQTRQDGGFSRIGTGEILTREDGAVCCQVTGIYSRAAVAKLKF